MKEKPFLVSSHGWKRQREREVEGVEEGGGVAALEEGIEEAGEPLEGGGGHEEGVAEGVRGAGEGIGELEMALAFAFAFALEEFVGFGGEGGGELVGEEEEGEDGVVWRERVSGLFLGLVVYV